MHTLKKFLETNRGRSITHRFFRSFFDRLDRISFYGVCLLMTFLYHQFKIPSSQKKKSKTQTPIDFECRWGLYPKSLVLDWYCLLS